MVQKHLTGFKRLNATLVQIPVMVRNASVMFNGYFLNFQGMIWGLRACNI
jgi:hypothetical protein